MRKPFWIALAIFLNSTISSIPQIIHENTNASVLLERIGVSRGICVVLGDSRCDLAIRLTEASELILYVQLPRG